MIRLEADGLAEFGDGLVHQPLFMKVRPEVRACLPMTRTEADGLPVGGNDLVRSSPFLAKSDAKVVVGAGVVRPQADGFPEFGDGLVLQPLRMKSPAEVVVCT